MGPQKLTDFYPTASDRLHQHGGALPPHGVHRHSVVAVKGNTTAALRHSPSPLYNQTNGEFSPPDSPTTHSPTKIKNSKQKGEDGTELAPVRSLTSLLLTRPLEEYRSSSHTNPAHTNPVLSEKCIGIVIYADLSASTLKNRRQFFTLTKALHNHKQDSNGVIHQGKKHVVHSIDRGIQLLKNLHTTSQQGLTT